MKEILERFISWCVDGGAPSLDSHVGGQMECSIDEFLESEKEKMMSFTFSCAQCQNHFDVVVKNPPKDYQNLKQNTGDMLLFMCPACFKKSMLKFGVGELVVNSLSSIFSSLTKTGKCDSSKIPSGIQIAKHLNFSMGEIKDSVDDENLGEQK